jgi:hypothetical protein
MQTTLFILFSVASQIRLLPLRHGTTLNRSLSTIDVNYSACSGLQCVGLSWNRTDFFVIHIIVWFPEIKEATLNTKHNYPK